MALSNTDNGGRVALRLPLGTADVATEPGLILLVQDSPDLRSTIRDMLRGAGHMVVEPFDSTKVVARVRARLRSNAPTTNPHDTARFNGWIAHFSRYVLEDESGAQTPFFPCRGLRCRGCFSNAPSG